MSHEPISGAIQAEGRHVHFVAPLAGGLDARNDSTGE
jgi:hypothetical protein